MTPDNILVLAILAGALVLFISERISIDLVALLVLLAITLTGLVTPDEAFSGFSSPAVITVWSVFIISAGLSRSGVADRLAQLILRLGGHSQPKLILILMLVSGGMSAFMNNIGAVAILLPAVVSIARETDTSPSKLLIPLAWASLLGGNMTLIGTPPNILAASLLQTYPDVSNLNFFDFTPMGIIVLTAGILYMLLIGRHILPMRTPGGDLRAAYPFNDYISEVKINPNSPLVGSTLEAVQLGERFDLNVIQIESNGDTYFSGSDRRLEAGDRLLVEAAPDTLLAASQALLLELPLRADTMESGTDPTENLQLKEIALAPRSHLNNRTIRQLQFRNRYGLSVLALRHAGRTFYTRLIDIPLQIGDSLLVEGPLEKIRLLRQDPNFMLLESPSPELRRTKKAPLALSILAGVIIAITAGWLPVSTAMLVGAVLTVLTGTLRMPEAYEAIEWRSVFLIAGMLPMGIAMENTGTAMLLADVIVQALGPLGPSFVMMGIFLITALLTEVMSNAAATVLIVPIAIDAALELGADPRAFVIAIVLAASTSFLMPIGHQVNVLIFGPGGYKFADYTRVGVWLNLILFILVWVTLPLIWPLFP